MVKAGSAHTKSPSRQVAELPGCQLAELPPFGALGVLARNRLFRMGARLSGRFCIPRGNSVGTCRGTAKGGSRSRARNDRNKERRK
jgi:hypothetical protein